MIELPHFLSETYDHVKILIFLPRIMRKMKIENVIKVCGMKLDR